MSHCISRSSILAPKSFARLYILNLLRLGIFYYRHQSSLIRFLLHENISCRFSVPTKHFSCKSSQLARERCNAILTNLRDFAHRNIATANATSRYIENSYECTIATDCECIIFRIPCECIYFFFFARTCVARFTFPQRCAAHGFLSQMWHSNYRFRHVK